MHKYYHTKNIFWVAIFTGRLLFTTHFPFIWIEKIINILGHKNKHDAEKLYYFVKLYIFLYHAKIRALLQWEVKQMKALVDWTPILWVDEIVEGFKALNFPKGDRCYPRIESAKSSFHPTWNRIFYSTFIASSVFVKISRIYLQVLIWALVLLLRRPESIILQIVIWAHGKVKL